MRSILREQKRSSTAAAVVTILVGLLLTFWPGHSVSLVCAVLGWGLAVTGVVYILGWIRRRRMGAPAFMILPGVILTALGLWLATRPDSVVLLIQYIFGAVLVFHGVVDLQGALALVRQGCSRCWLDLVLSVLTAGFGLLILVNPFGTFATLITLIGLALIFDGASDLYLIHRLAAAVKDYDNNGDW